MKAPRQPGADALLTPPKVARSKPRKTRSRARQRAPRQRITPEMVEANREFHLLAGAADAPGEPRDT